MVLEFLAAEGEEARVEAELAAEPAVGPAVLCSDGEKVEGGQDQDDDEVVLAEAFEQAEIERKALSEAATAKKKGELATCLKAVVSFKPVCGQREGEPAMVARCICGDSTWCGHCGAKLEPGQPGLQCKGAKCDSGMCFDCVREAVREEEEDQRRDHCGEADSQDQAGDQGQSLRGRAMRLLRRRKGER
mmetsp:Transcript_87481/g.270868  ORF Transcript_87481/g.270868 Transcript_87481/m.270868 type:complete len:189 (+) Transcript_87481:742-1308(+)